MPHASLIPSRTATRLAFPDKPRRTRTSRQGRRTSCRRIVLARDVCRTDSTDRASASDTASPTPPRRAPHSDTRHQRSPPQQRSRRTRPRCDRMELRRAAVTVRARTQSLRRACTAGVRVRSARLRTRAGTRGVRDLPTPTGMRSVVDYASLAPVEPECGHEAAPLTVQHSRGLATVVRQVPQLLQRRPRDDHTV